jgi:dienelactone hydrolase
METLMITESLEYQDGDTLLEGYLAYEPSDQPRPLVLVSHDWVGCGQNAKEAAERMASMGFVGFALDMYGKGIMGEEGNAEVNAALMNPFAEDRALLRQRILAALTVGRQLDQVDSSKVAAMGFCFGGMCVLELARSGADVQGVISVHGILAPGAVANEAISAKVLCLHGHDDPMAPPDQVLAFETEMTEAGADWQLHAYGGTLHAFTNPKANDPDFGVQYKEIASRRAYQSLSNFLDELFA